MASTNLVTMPEETFGKSQAAAPWNTKFADIIIKTILSGSLGTGITLLNTSELPKLALGAGIGGSTPLVYAFIEPIFKKAKRGAEQAGDTVADAMGENLEQLRIKATRLEDIYLLAQAQDCRDFKTEGMGVRDRISIPMLQEVFVPLQLDGTSIQAGFRTNRTDIDPSQTTCIWDVLTQVKQQPAYRQLAIIAWGGFGKTTLLKHLAYTYGIKQRGKFRAPSLIPVLLPLRGYRTQLNQDSPPDLPSLIMNEHIYKNLAELDPRLKQLPANWFREVLSSGKALVMMDGFDEIPAAERARLSRWISAQMRRFDKSVFILASRPTAYNEDFGANPLRTKLWVQPLKPQQQENFVRQWYLCQEKLARGGRDTAEVKREAKQSADNLLKQIRDPERPELARLSINPLLLTLLAICHRSNPTVELPRQRAELYQDICMLQLRRRPEARSIPMPLKHDECQAVLQAVALKMMQDYLKLMPEDDLVALIAQILAAHNQVVAADDFLQQIIDVSELIVRQGLEGCEFSHLSFQEFLAAAQIKASNQETLLYPYLKDTQRDQNHADDTEEEKAAKWWRSTILLYAAHSNSITLIEKALEQGASDLAYACAQELSKPLNPILREKLESLRQQVQISRYAKLEQLLKARQWAAADYETYRLMITTVGKEEGQWFDIEDLENFPHEELIAIDTLWVDNSGGKFGFSIQKQIWQACGMPMGSSKDWNRFCRQVGWQNKQGGYVSYSDLQKNPTTHLRGMLPTATAGRSGGWDTGGWGVDLGKYWAWWWVVVDGSARAQLSKYQQEIDNANHSASLTLVPNLTSLQKKNSDRKSGISPKSRSRKTSEDVLAEGNNRETFLDDLWRQKSEDHNKVVYEFNVASEFKVAQANANEFEDNDIYEFEDNDLHNPEIDDNTLWL